MEEDVQEEQVTLIQDSQNEVSTHLRHLYNLKQLQIVRISG